MDEIAALFTLDYQSLLLGFLAILIGFQSVLKVKDWYIARYRIKTGADTDKETIEERIGMLEKHDNWQYKEITKIVQGIEDIKRSQLDTNIDSMRWEILDFASALMGGRKYNRESFDHIYRIYEKYETILKDNKMTNGFVDDSMKIVSEYYRAQFTENLKE